MLLILSLVTTAPVEARAALLVLGVSFFGVGLYRLRQRRR
jgi:hypothetical protein